MYVFRMEKKARKLIGWGGGGQAGLVWSSFLLVLLGHDGASAEEKTFVLGDIGVKNCLMRHLGFYIIKTLLI